MGYYPKILIFSERNTKMKKFLALALSALLFVAAFAVPVAAVDWKDGQTTNEAGTYTFDNAYGFVFNVNSVNGTIAGEDATVITSAEEYNASNPNWAISVLLAPTSEANVYEVVTVVVTPGSAAAGMEKGINFDDGNIVLLVHSSGSLPEQTKEDGTVQTFANWQAKVAAMALKTGDKITLAGIDLEAATATSATATVQDAPEGYEVTNGVPEEPTTVPEVITVDGDLSDIKAYVIKDGKAVQIDLYILDMTENEREIVKAGSLINFNRNR